jgi:hypothetical protein
LRPLLYVGGESEPARALVTDLGDVWLVNGQLPPTSPPCSTTSAHRARAGLTVSFGGYRESGIRVDRSPHALHEYSRLKTTWVHWSATP